MYFVLFIDLIYLFFHVRATLFDMPATVTRRMVSSVRQSLPPDVDKWEVSLQLLMGAVVVGGVVVAGCYRWMQENVITDPDCVDATRWGEVEVDFGGVG